MSQAPVVLRVRQPGDVRIPDRWFYYSSPDGHMDFVIWNRGLHTVGAIGWAPLQLFDLDLIAGFNHAPATVEMRRAFEAAQARRSPPV